MNDAIHRLLAEYFVNLILAGWWGMGIGVDEYEIGKYKNLGRKQK